MAPHYRPFLAIAQTTLTNVKTKKRFEFNGLFTTRHIGKGSFIGFYNGTFHDSGEAGYRGKDAYVFTTSGQYIVPKRPRGSMPDPAKYPLAMANEPPRGTVANVTAVELTRARGVISQLPPNTQISAIGFFACRDIEAGEELFVHYGPRYNRNSYPNPEDIPQQQLVGEPCKLLVKERQLPIGLADEFDEFGVAYLHVDPECYVELI